MKKSLYLAAAAVLLMATTNAYAGNGISFEIGGQKIHIDASRNCGSIDCVSVSKNGEPINLKNIKGKKSNDDDVTTNSPAPPAPPAPAPVASNPPPAPAATYAPPAPPAPPAPVADASHERLSGLPANNDQPSRAANNAPVTTYAPPAPVANNAPTAPPAPVAAPVATQTDPNSPLGLWATADNKGNVRIEQCGANLCGFSEHTNDRILINMKPSSDNKWTGRIHDPESGSNYDSIIALKGPNLLNVQGCGFGGLFCGGQTWKRIS